MRIRTIKPEFWRNRKLATLGREVHDLAARLITACDDEGYAEADPALLAGDLYPFDTDAQRFIRKSLPELERIGFAEIRGGEFGVLRLPKFRDHQRINRPTPSRLRPRFEQVPGTKQLTEDSLMTHGALTEHSPTEVEVEVDREQGTGNVKQGAAPPLEVTGVPPRADHALEVFEHYRKATGKTRAVLDKKRRELIDRRLAEGHSLEDIKAAIDGYAKSPWHNGENDRKRKFLGLDLMLRDAAHIEAGLDLLMQTNAMAPQSESL